MSGENRPPFSPQTTTAGRISPPQTTHDAADVAYAWRVFSVTSLGVILTGLNSSTLDVGLPAVARHFHPTPTQASWFLLSYQLVNTVLILIFGRIADMVGRRRLYIAGLVTFTTGSLGCGLAPTSWALIGWRAVQAIGAAAVITNTTAQLTDVFPRRMLGTALGLNVTVISAAQIAGPVVGGALVATFGWAWVFLFNVPVGVIGVIWAVVTLRRTPRGRPRGRFDLLGAGLTVVWLGSLVVALSAGGAQGWGTPSTVYPLVVMAATLPLFVWWQTRTQDPLVDLALLRDRARAAAYAANFALAVARFALVLLASLFFQAVQGLDAFTAGLRVAPLALGIMVASPLAGYASGRFPTRVVSTLGALTCSGGLAFLALTVEPQTSYLFVSTGLFVVGIGSGTFMTPNTSSIMASVPAHTRGVANGLRSMLQNTGFVMSTALSLAIVTAPLTQSEKRGVYSGTLSRLPSSDVVHFVDAYRTALFVLLGVCLTAVLSSLLRGRAPQPDGDDVAVAERSP